MYFEVENGKIVFKPVPQIKPLNQGEVLIERYACGICRSDVGVYDGRESIPPGMFGHEAIGTVISSRSEYFTEGQYVASFWHPGYADFFVAHESKCVEIPELSPKYTVVQPLACVLNALDFAEGRTLLIGRGFTAQLAMMAVSEYPNIVLITEDELLSGEIFDSVLEMSGRGLPDTNLFKDEANLIWFSTLQSPTTTNFFEWSWKALRVFFPSPRQSVMDLNMGLAVRILQEKTPPITHIFNFENAPMAFEIASKRLDGYLKGVLKK